MKVGGLEFGDLRDRLRGGSLAFRIGGFDVCLKSSLPGVAEDLSQLYRAHSLIESPELADFHIELKAPGLIRRYFRPQVCFSSDGFTPFKPLPQDQAFASFEWGLNWCVASSAHHDLVIHAAVVERNGKAFIFPGTPGSGKSTLSAALALRGWRLLSDEMALVSLEDGLVTPFPRPVSLKNESIEVMRAYSDEVWIGDVVRDTAKGTVGHMRPPEASVQRGAERAVPAFIVFPKYRAGSDIQLTPRSRGRALMEVASNSFNYHVLGREGFEFLLGMIESCDSYTLEYQDLDEAIELLAGLAE